MIIFAHPWALALAALAIPLVAAAWFATPGVDTARRIAIGVGRTVVVFALALVLAEPSVRREHDTLTVIGVLDVSDSVRRFADLEAMLGDAAVTGAAARNSWADPDGFASRNDPRQPYVTWLRSWFRAATDSKVPDDRLGLVVFDGEATAIIAPTGGTPPEPTVDVRVSTGTAIEDAVRLGLAMFPADTSRRLVLVTDGNETQGDVLSAVRLAAAGGDAGIAGDGTPGSGPSIPIDVVAGAGIPIDVLPIPYEVGGDTRVVEVNAPTTAQPEQIVDVRIVLESSQAVTGRLSVTHEGRPVDANGDAPGRDRRVQLEPGRTAFIVPVRLGTTPINRIEATFAPDDPSADILPENDRAAAIVATPGRGRILVIAPDAVSGRAPSPDDDATGIVRDTAPITQLLARSGLPFDAVTPEAAPRSLLDWQDADLVILDNVSSSELPLDTQSSLARHVEDLGGGLLVIGGDRSYGAGGWARTPISEILPILVDPPPEMILPTAALVLVLDQSGSMAVPVAGARASQQEVANESAARAIESLRPESLVGVIGFSGRAQTIVPLRRNTDAEAISSAVRTIMPGGGTNIRGALVAANEMLAGTDADRKYVVLLTDGQSDDAGLDTLAEEMAASGIRITTIGIGNEIDDQVLEAIAGAGDGEFIRVLSPRSLPRVLVDSVQIVNKPLIKEGPFSPVILPTGSRIGEGLADVPPLRGLVVTAPRPDPGAIVELAHPDGEPLLARWPAGLGQVAAFTSDYGRGWGDEWLASPAAEGFWLRLIRSTQRVRTDGNATLSLEIRDGRLLVDLDVGDAEGTVDFLNVPGTVFGPRGRTPIRLRQSAPGRYVTDVDAGLPGEYVVALTPRLGDAVLPPVIGGASRRGGEEFARRTANLTLLDTIVASTGGRRLDPTDPTAVDLFDRDGMEPRVSLQTIWRPITFALLALFILDIATRRIAWTGAGIREAVTMRLDLVRHGSRAASQRAAATATLRERTGAGGRDDAGSPEEAARRREQMTAALEADAQRTRRAALRAAQRRVVPPASDPGRRRTEAGAGASGADGASGDAARAAAGSDTAPGPTRPTKPARPTTPSGDAGGTPPGGRAPIVDRRALDDPPPAPPPLDPTATTSDRPADAPDDGPPPDDAARPTEGLLAAKRRARRQMDD